MYPIRRKFTSTTIAVPSATVLASTTSSMNLTYCWSTSFRCTATGYIMVTNPRKSLSICTQFLQHGALLPRPTFWKAVPTPKKLAALPPGTSTSSCIVSSKLNSFPIRPPIRKKYIPLGLVVAAAKGSAYSFKGKLPGDLIKMALYFYLLSCEYMKTNSHKQTTQFRLCDMQFHDAWASSHLNPLHISSFRLQWLPFSSILRRNQCGENPSPWKQPTYPLVELYGQRQSNLLISVFMRPTFIPLYAPTLLHLKVLDGRSQAKMLWISSAYGWRKSVSSGWVPPSKHWPPFAPF